LIFKKFNILNNLETAKVVSKSRYGRVDNCNGLIFRALYGSPGSNPGIGTFKKREVDWSWSQLSLISSTTEVRILLSLPI
jgi:hypothetical protein